MCKKVLLTMVLVFSMSLVASAQTWNLMDDYSELPSMANPDGAWMYGFYNASDGLGRAFVSLWVHEIIAADPSLERWGDSFNLNLNTGKLVDDWADPWAAYTVPAGDGWLTPGDPYDSGMGWIAPEDLTVTITAECYGIGSGNVTANLVHISDTVHGIVEDMGAHGTNTGCTGTRSLLQSQSGIQYFNYDYSRENPLVLTATLDVSAGDMLTLECNNEDGYSCDFLGVKSIAVTVVPEPITMAFLGFGSLALLRRKHG